MLGFLPFLPRLDYEDTISGGSILLGPNDIGICSDRACHKDTAFLGDLVLLPLRISFRLVVLVSYFYISSPIGRTRYREVISDTRIFRIVSSLRAYLLLSFFGFEGFVLTMFFVRICHGSLLREVVEFQNHQAYRIFLAHPTLLS